MTTKEKEKLREEFNSLKPTISNFGACLPVSERIHWIYQDIIFDFIVSKLEEKDKEQKKEIKRLKELVQYIYQFPTIQWHMKYKINQEFPDLVKMLNSK